MDFFTVIVVMFLVALIFVTFKYPTESYVQIYGRRENFKRRLIFIISSITIFFVGVCSIAELSVFALTFFIDVTTTQRIICYFIAFMVEAVGNLLYILIKYGGISELSNIEIIYDDDYEEEEEERISNVINIEDYRRNRKR